MISTRAGFAPLFAVLFFVRAAAAQNSSPEPAAPPLPPPPPPPYNPPPPPPYTGPPMNTGPSLNGDLPRFHDRFYLRMSLGGGALATSGDFSPDNGNTFETHGGCVAFDLAIGGTPVPGFVIGGDYAFQEAFRPRLKLSSRSITTEGDSNVNTVFGLLGPFVDWFPDPRGGFHFGGTLGFAVLAVANDNGNIDNSASENGFGGALRLGYDAWISNDWSLGVLGQFVGGRVSAETNSVTERDSVQSFSVLFTALYH